ncbi:DNA-binding transcriptional regulator OxyR (plasmid) [Ruegeria sp. THAF33]|nr:DNA-binding transcriptional regulator OxyR [Ruegeria sp. THAF33]
MKVLARPSLTGCARYAITARSPVLTNRSAGWPGTKFKAARPTTLSSLEHETSSVARFWVMTTVASPVALLSEVGPGSCSAFRLPLRVTVRMSPLANQIEKLEQELGTGLFLRLNNEVRPTLYGARVVERAGRLLNDAQKIRDTATEFRDPETVPLTVGMPPT